MSTSKLTIGFSLFEDEKILFLRYNSHVIYIIGSTHTDAKYAMLAEQVVEYVQPDIVGVELCRTRIGYKNYLSTIKSDTKHDEFNFESIPQHKRQVAIGEKLRLLYAYGAIQYEESKAFRQKLRSYRMLRSFRLDKIVRMDNITIGAELYVPFGNYAWHSAYRLGPKYLLNFNVKYKILLLDRPIADTYRNIAKVLSEKEKILVRIYKRHFPKYFSNGHGALMQNIWSENESLRNIFINKRDEHMASMIYDAVAVHRFDKLVCIVGKAHTAGIVKHLQEKFDKKI